MPNKAEQQGITCESEFLCAKCGQPLYVQLGSRREVCLNAGCGLWPSEYSSVADAHKEHAAGLYRKIEEETARITDRIRRCNLASLRRFAQEKRRTLALSFLNKGGMRISEWHAISELLVLTQREPAKRLHTIGDESESMFEAILQEVAGWAERMRRMEDLRTGRYLVLRRLTGNLDEKPFALKYLLATRADQHALGFVNSAANPHKATLEYEHIERAAIPAVGPNTADLADRLETLWPFTLHFRHALRSHWRTSQLYNYHPRLMDFVALAGYWISSIGDDRTHRIPADKEAAETEKLDAHLRKYSSGEATAEEFIRRYIDCQDQAPVIVRTPEGWLLDKTTLLLFILYLQGEPSLVDRNSPRLKEPLLARMQQRAGHEFEMWLRSELQGKDFKGPNEPVKMTKAGYEYDLLMVSGKRRLVILADAKYRDVAPSSVTGASLLENELLGDHGLLEEGRRQDERLAYFLNNKTEFGKFLGPEREWEDFEVKSYLVTKSTPLISKCGNTFVARSNEFLSSISAER